MSRHPEFDQAPGLVYLNHAAVAPWPERTRAAVSRFAAENQLRGAQHYRHWLEVEQRLRGQLQRLINADATAEIALLKSTSEGLSVIAHGLDWHPGDTIVTAREEFPSNRVTWQSLAPQGVTTRLVELAGRDDPEAALLDAVDDSTRLLSISAVQYADGLRMDLPRIGAFLEARGLRIPSTATLVRISTVLVAVLCLVFALRSNTRLFSIMRSSGATSQSWRARPAYSRW